MQRLRVILSFVGCLLATSGAPLTAQDDGSYPFFRPELFRLPPIEEDSPSDLPMPTESRPLPAKDSVATPEPSSSPKEVAAKVDVVVLPASGPLPWWKPWEGSFELGMNGTTGNMETFNLRIGAKAKRSSPLWAHTAEFTHIDKTNNNRSIAYNLLFDGRVERLFVGTPWSLYAHGLTEYDEFKAFDVRVSTDLGVGYQWIKSDVSKLLTRFGPSVSREIGGVNDRYIPELDFGLEFEHAFNSRNKVALKSDYFPSVRDFADFRANTRASWEVVVAPAWGVSLKFSLIDRYDSTPGKAQRNDLDYSLLALWNF